MVGIGGACGAQAAASDGAWQRVRPPLAV
jgi:hypothetical protein